MAFVLLPQVSKSLPWTMPGDFLQRFQASDLVVAATVESSFSNGIETVDGADLGSNVARIHVDSIFQGKGGEELQFTWFTLPVDGTMGFAFAGPPLANFQPYKRYLIFLKRQQSDWVVAIPAYSIEVRLASDSPKPSVRDFSELAPQQRYDATAEELQNAALVLPVPPPGMTGEASTYFGPVFDLIGACAEPFYRRFLSSPSNELRDESLRWINLINSRRLACSRPFIISNQ
jgi:hypothetical protein